jgi:hypothetical protein
MYCSRQIFENKCNISAIYTLETCSKCGTEEETSVHILDECEALASLRHPVALKMGGVIVV